MSAELSLQEATKTYTSDLEGAERPFWGDRNRLFWRLHEYMHLSDSVHCSRKICIFYRILIILQ